MLGMMALGFVQLAEALMMVPFGRTPFWEVERVGLGGVLDGDLEGEEGREGLFTEMMVGIVGWVDRCICGRDARRRLKWPWWRRGNMRVS